jgi:hypothetical protein
VLLDDVPLQKSYFSSNTTEYPLEEASKAQPSPEAPPPIIIKSYFLLFNNLIFEDLFNFKELF